MVMSNIKGFTVHLANAEGKAVCGVLKPRSFMGKPGLSTNPRYVTCHKCERAARPTTTDSLEAK